MTTEEVQDFVTRFAAAWAARDGNAFLELWHPDGTLTTPLVDRPVKGSELARLMEVQTVSAPDFVWQLLDWTSRGNVVIIEWQTTRHVDGAAFRMARRRQVPHQGRQDRGRGGLQRHRAAARVPFRREAGADHEVLTSRSPCCCLVVAGLDPAIHHLERGFFSEGDGCAGQARA